MSIIVQKYGGSSLPDTRSILKVASRIAKARESGDSIVVVVSAMGKTTDLLIDMAKSISARTDPRELDALLSTGELQSCSLMTMALHSLGCSAISLSGAQAGILTDARHRRA